MQVRGTWCHPAYNQLSLRQKPRDIECSLRKQPFLLAPRRLERLTWRNEAARSKEKWLFSQATLRVLSKSRNGPAGPDFLAMK